MYIITKGNERKKPAYVCREDSRIHVIQLEGKGEIAKEEIICTDFASHAATISTGIRGQLT